MIWAAAARRLDCVEGRERTQEAAAAAHAQQEAALSQQRAALDQARTELATERERVAGAQQVGALHHALACAHLMCISVQLCTIAHKEGLFQL